MPLEESVETIITMRLQRRGEGGFADATDAPANYSRIMHDISFVTVNYLADDFLQLLLESIERFASASHEIIVIDNSITNRGHGEGLNEGAGKATGKWTCFLDVDCHFLKHGWDNELIAVATEIGIDVFAGKGSVAKPIRPAFVFLKTEIAKQYDWRSTPGYRGHRLNPDGFDTAISAYHEMRRDQRRIHLLDWCRLYRYGTSLGEELVFGDDVFLYHHWHGASLQVSERHADNPGIDLYEEKRKLFDSIPWRIL
jgi:GT2 family glycosyltransferase